MKRSRTWRLLNHWLFHDESRGHHKHSAKPAHAHTSLWTRVMCLTGVDYFSTLGYQPGIAFLAAGAVSPIATIVLVLLTLFGAYPIYSRVAAASPHGEGSIAMLEDLLPKWSGKLFVLCLLGFVATDFIITITLSAADGAAHVIENPFVPEALHHPILVTLLLVALLGGIFLKGFKEAIGVAVVLVVLYLGLNIVVIGDAVLEVIRHPTLIPDWKRALFESHGNVAAMVGMALLLFPKLALGLSGFETGVAVMPLIRGDATDTEQHPEGRIRATRKLLRTAALIMSVFLISSSFVTTLLIPAKEFLPGGAANGRALAYIAHKYLGNGFGTLYDISTIMILWFAGASAMAGLLNIIPRYLPRYGMAPDWARATRPLVLVFTAIAFVVTLVFQADVNAQGGAYATGVLVLMTSAGIAVTLLTWQKGAVRWAFLFIAVVFAYTTIVNIIERPEGIKIASFFIGTIIIVSAVSRIMRSMELRVHEIVFDERALEFIREAATGQIRFIANRRQTGDAEEYARDEDDKRRGNHIPLNLPILFLEVDIDDASEFEDALCVEGIDVEGYRILRTRSPAVPNALAAILLEVRDLTGKIPHIYFGWSEGSPVKQLFRFIFLGEGDTAPVTREVLRKAERNRDKRPSVHIGG